MTRQSLARSTFVVLTAIFAATLGAQTTPWPFSAKPGVQPSAPGHSVTVAFWNIQWFPGTHPNPSHDDEVRQTKIVHEEMAKLSAADIIGMEEVRNYEQAGVAVQPLPGFKVDVCANWPPREGQNE